MADGTITSVDELKQHVGKETRVGDWHEVTQQEINAFADATGDHQWIHVDPERAKKGPFGGTIAHGYWTLSSAAFILRGGNGGEGIQVQLPSRMGVNYGLNRVRFLSPVHAGKRTRPRARLGASAGGHPHPPPPPPQPPPPLPGDPNPP